MRTIHLPPLIGAVSIVTAFFVLQLTSPSPAADRPLSDALPPGHPSCHARVLAAAERTDPQRRIGSIALERTTADVAAERKWAKLEQFDDTPVVSATLRVR